MYEKYHLPRFAYAVDGMMTAFVEKPRRIPAHIPYQRYWSRKQHFAINVQVVSNDEFIYDIDVGWPGNAHDSRIWHRSRVRHHIEADKHYLIAGDSGYAISPVLMKPYSANDSNGNPSKTLFNRRLSGLRTAMSENIFGQWKRRFPILKSFRTDLDLSQKIIIATAILFNIGKLWNDQMNEEDEEDEQDEEEDEQDEDEDRDPDNEPIDWNLPAAVIRFAGQQVRDALRTGMA